MSDNSSLSMKLELTAAESVLCSLENSTFFALSGAKEVLSMLSRKTLERYLVGELIVAVFVFSF